MEENDEYRPVGGGAEILRFARAASGDVMDEARRLLEAMVGYKDLRMMYSCALKEVRTKFEVLNMEFNVRHRRNPISSINTRLKSNQSIMEKMRRRSVPFSLENLQKHIQDVAGVRVICSYVDDIYLLSEALLRQDDIALLARKDYIRHPKPNGYRSLHLIVRVPVFFADQKRELPVEVQIRTIAMDFWASLEHQMKYKQNIPEQEAIVEQLRLCAQRVSELDEEMMSIRSRIEAAKDNPSQDDVLLERLTHLEAPLD
ncbi:MAG: GTP pyrophosphokinase family protein [Christensenellales bacterium]|nr:GTP pyrophosphokinase family protein [Christensenellales bacterium]